MKKLAIICGLVCAAMCSQAATVSWKYTGAAEDVGYSIYVFTAPVGNHYDTFTDFTDASISGSATAVTSKKVGPKTTYGAESAVSSDSIVKGTTTTLYVALIKDSSATEFTYGSIDVTGLVYGDQDSVPGLSSFTSAAFANAGTIGSVPEPTSGLLLLLGMAGLALKRKRA